MIAKLTGQGGDAGERISGGGGDGGGMDSTGEGSKYRGAQGLDPEFIAKLEQKREGRLRSFDEEAVQAKIQENLISEQLATLRRAKQERLIKNAVIEPENPDITPVVEMAMQRYREWSGKN